jgi:GxxExxY protein
MTELDFQFLARPEPSVIISGFSDQASLLGDLGVFARDCFWFDVTENEVAKQVVDAAYRVHTSLGPGLLESPYEAVLAYELEKRGLRTVRQQAVPILYQGTRIEVGYRADLIVEDSVIVEIKSVETVAPLHKKQLLTHLRLADKRLGLLINFNVPLIKDGITRIANGMPD